MQNRTLEESGELKKTAILTRPRYAGAKTPVAYNIINEDPEPGRYERPTEVEENASRQGGRSAIHCAPTFA